MFSPTFGYNTCTMIASRQRRCPLRKPRVWLWALGVVLPGHVMAAYALGLQNAGQAVVVCPFPTSMRVALVAAPQVATPAASTPHVSQPAPQRVSFTPKSKPLTDQGKQSPSLHRSDTQASLEPAAGPSHAAAAVPIMGVQSLGFQMPPIPPAYPAHSRAMGEEGTALLLAELHGQGGQPVAIKLEKSSGYPALDTAAMDAAKQWHFNAPHTSVWVRLPIRFALKN